MCRCDEVDAQISAIRAAADEAEELWRRQRDLLARYLDCARGRNRPHETTHAAWGGGVANEGSITIAQRSLVDNEARVTYWQFRRGDRGRVLMPRYLLETVAGDGVGVDVAVHLAAQRFRGIDVERCDTTGVGVDARVLRTGRAPSATHLRRWAVAARFAVAALRRLSTHGISRPTEGEQAR